ncbi:hypothetical protein ACQPZQ_01705 [Pseudonocardia sp. CA-142604]|uniref:hypothetical protein n=1 Tax=Pseudonocardia sp. CA-142604 TaxID=3240024 RepID=UPI003D91D7E8
MTSGDGLQCMEKVHEAWKILNRPELSEVRGGKCSQASLSKMVCDGIDDQPSGEKTGSPWLFEGTFAFTIGTCRLAPRHDSVAADFEENPYACSAA